MATKPPNGIYTFSGRPGSSYKYENNQWFVSNSGTKNQYVPMQDPTGNRAKTLEAGLKSGKTQFTQGLGAAQKYPNGGGMKTVKSKDGTITNKFTNKEGNTVVQVKTKDGRYYEKVLEPQIKPLDNTPRYQNALLNNPAVVADNTRVANADFAAAAVANKPNVDRAVAAEKKAQYEFEKDKWEDYNKMSPTEKVVDRVDAFLTDPLGMFSRAVSGEQAYIPGMGQGLVDYENPNRNRYLQAVGYTPGKFEPSDIQNMANPGYWGASITNNLNKGNYGTAAAETALSFLPFLPKGSAGLARQGTAMLLNDINKAIPYGTPFLEEVAGSLKNTNRKAQLREAEDWVNYWVQHPATQEKILNSYKKGLSDRKLTPTKEHNLSEIMGYAGNYNAKNRLKEYPLLKQGLGKQNIHSGNDGLSTTHFELPGQILAEPTNTFNPSTNSKSFTDFDNYTFNDQDFNDLSNLNPLELDAMVKASSDYGNWISRKLGKESRISTGIHELSHDWIKDYILENTELKDELVKGINTSKVEELANKYKGTKLENKVLENLKYHQDPSELFSRLMEARKHFNLSPEQKITADQADEFLNLISAGKTPVDHVFGKIIARGKQAADFFNNPWSWTGIAAGSTQLGQDTNIKAKGGSLAKNIPTYYNYSGTPIYRDTTALPFPDGGYLSLQNAMLGPLPEREKPNSVLAYNKFVEATKTPNQSAYIRPSYYPESNHYKYGFFGANSGNIYGGAGYGVPKYGLEANVFGTIPAQSDPYYKGFYSAQLAKQFGNNQVGLGVSSPVVGYTDDSGFHMDRLELTPQLSFRKNFADGGPLNDKTNHGKILNSIYASALGDYYASGGMLKRADGSYSRRGLWDNIRAAAARNKAQGKPGKAPTKEMLEQAKVSSKANGGFVAGRQMYQPLDIRESYGGFLYGNGGQFPTTFSLPEDSFKQGGNNLHDSVYASSMAQYPAVYGMGGSILSMSNTPELSGEGKDLSVPENAYIYSAGGSIKKFKKR